MAGILSKLISSDQNRFVRERQIEDSINGMLATFEEQYHNPAEGAEDSAAVVLLDFAKAYGSLERDFLDEVFAHLGFGEPTINMICALLSP